MALFTDGLLTTMEGLLAYESSLLETARTEGIDLGVKLRLAQEELGLELRRFLVQQGAARLGLKNVVVSDGLRKWHTFRTLALTYRDAYNSQLNDRYLAKWKEWERMAEWAWRAAIEAGIGIVEKPVAKAERPELSTAPAGAGGATYYVRAAWVSATGDEGAASEAAILTTENGEGLVARAVKPPEEAAGWNVYAGYSEGETWLQNAAPMAPGEAWSGAELAVGRGPGEGQAPDYYLRRGARQRDTEEGEAPGLLLRG